MTLLTSNSQLPWRLSLPPTRQSPLTGIVFCLCCDWIPSNLFLFAWQQDELHLASPRLTSRYILPISTTPKILHQSAARSPVELLLHLHGAIFAKTLPFKSCHFRLRTGPAARDYIFAILHSLLT